MGLETTVVLFKPDALEKRLIGQVTARFEAIGMRIRGAKMFRFDDALLREHYAHIASRPFFPEVQRFMQKAPGIAIALEGDDAVARVRAIVGPTNSKKAPKGTIRGDFGEDVMANVCHASDSRETAALELKRFFEPHELF